jgi:hypothetical protein
MYILIKMNMKHYKQEERISITTKSWIGGAEGYSVPKSKNNLRKEKIKRLYADKEMYRKW